MRTVVRACRWNHGKRGVNEIKPREAEEKRKQCLRIDYSIFITDFKSDSSWKLLPSSLSTSVLFSLILYRHSLSLLRSLFGRVLSLILYSTTYIKKKTDLFFWNIAPNSSLKITNYIVYTVLSILYIQKFFGLYCHDRIAWSDENKKEWYIYFIKIPSSSVFFSKPNGGLICILL